MGKVEIESKIIIADLNPAVSEFGRSLVSRFGEMLVKAQELFGQRDMSYTIVGVEFMEGVQRTDYLGAEWDKQLIIHLPTSGLQTFDGCLYMLAHETIHCLTPDRHVKANRLEEGLAEYFAKWYMNFLNMGNDWKSMDDDYVRVMRDVEALIAINPEVIKKVRQIQPNISLVSKDNLTTALNKDIGELGDRLIVPFTKTPKEPVVEAPVENPLAVEPIVPETEEPKE